MTVLTDLTADVYKAAQIVSREKLGYANAAMVNSSEEVAAQGTKIKSLFAPSAEVVAITPASTVPNSDSQNLRNEEVTIDQLYQVPIRWTGEQIKGANQTIRGSSGQSYETILGNQIEEAVRAIANRVERDTVTQVLTNAAYAVGTAATTPFASDADVASEAISVLDAAGAPSEGRCMVLGTQATKNLRDLSAYRADSERSDDRTLRTGMMADLYGAKVYQSHAVEAQNDTAAGVHASQQVNGAASQGAGTVTIDGGNGAVANGSFVNIGNYNYGVRARAAAATTLTLLGKLLEDVADDASVDAVASSVRNTVFHMNAIEIAMRPPRAGNDMAIDQMVFTDPMSKLVFRLAMYPGFMQHTLFVQALWGIKVWQPEHVVVILG